MTIPPAPAAGPDGLLTWVAALSGSIAATAAITWAGLATATGQRWDGLVLEGSRLGRDRVWQVAEQILAPVSVATLAVVLAATVAIAAVRRRPWQMAQAVVVLAGANLSTQVLKYRLLDVAPLVPGGPDDVTLPSGHTTAAASAGAALLLVVPARLRPAATVVAAGATAAMGWSTLARQWHRPSDVLAAIAVVAVWTVAACGLSWLERHRADFRAASGADSGADQGGTPDGRPAVTVALLALTGAGAAVVSVLLARELLDGVGRVGDSDGSTRVEQLLAYGGGTTAVLAASALAFALMLHVRHRCGRGVDEPGRHPVTGSRPA